MYLINRNAEMRENGGKGGGGVKKGTVRLKIVIRIEGECNPHYIIKLFVYGHLSLFLQPFVWTSLCKPFENLRNLYIVGWDVQWREILQLNICYPNFITNTVTTLHLAKYLAGIEFV